VKAETAVTKACIDAVNASCLAFCWRNQTGVVRVKRGMMHLAPVGSPDIVGWLRDGRFLGLETKVDGNRTEKTRAAAQSQWRERICSAGGVAGEVRSAAEAIALVRASLGLAAA
jgi:hypothetical protein